MKANFLGRLRTFDAHPKTLDDFRVKTFSGAAVSIVSGLFILFLFFSELSMYVSTETTDQLFVDTTRGEKLPINFNITFMHIPCALLSLDAMDVSGDHQLDVAHNVLKKRLTKEGQPVGAVSRETAVSKPEKEEEARMFDKLKEMEANKETYCGSCYGSEEVEGQCCNTCDAVRESYRKKGWAFNDPEKIEQCMKEGLSVDLDAQSGEGCLVFGTLQVNKVAGNFHFAPGKSFMHSHVHIHDLMTFGSKEFNVSHLIHKLSFGEDFPGSVHPLDDERRIMESTQGMFQYFLKVVPTVYQKLDGKTIHTNQYSVTEHFRGIRKDRGRNLPGVFFFYDLSPIMVQIRENRKSFPHFLTQLCAIIGGVFTVAGIIDSFIYSTSKIISKKIELGKFS